MRPQPHLLLAIVVLAADVCGPKPINEVRLPPEAVRLQLLNWFSRMLADGKLTIQKKRLHNEDLCRRFYADRGFKPAWCSEQGLTPLAEAKFYELQGAYRDGLNPDDYHTDMLFHLWIEEKRSALWSVPREQTERRAAMDIFLTDGYLLYLPHHR